jgi:hypothetical protein
LPIDPVDPDVQKSFRGTDCFDMLLLELADSPHALALARQWRENRTKAGLPIVHAFDGKDGAADACLYLVEAMLHLVKLRVELSAAAGTGRPSIEIAMAMTGINRSFAHTRQALIDAFESHVSIHGVGLALG